MERDPSASFLWFGKGKGRPGLEGEIAAYSGGVEGVDGGENGVDVNTAATIGGRVQDQRRVIPEVLEMTQDLWCKRRRICLCLKGASRPPTRRSQVCLSGSSTS
ncbi:uncharacterized protein N7525_005475 [Penicillium rubens]|jgi:hypothetical protein|uniref:uncharacterized protein n=1 Tax=Penicillium rubens TaxID=1108849 RepID=UPI002A5AEA60|nr:uncharacterized protein N7525_005475 [Penicillium rubens]KAJ5840287.1 hypothetical protein N7525_005475 [Penicillium rubens]